MTGAIINILLLSVAIFIVAQILPGIEVKGFGTAVLVALVYSLIHFLLFWILVVLSLPFVLLTFGLFIFVINAFLLWLTSRLISDFRVSGVGTTLLASVLITVCSTLLRWLI